MFFYSIHYVIAELEGEHYRCINVGTPKIVAKIRYRCLISIFGGFIQY